MDASECVWMRLDTCGCVWVCVCVFPVPCSPELRFASVTWNSSCGSVSLGDLTHTLAATGTDAPKTLETLMPLVVWYPGKSWGAVVSMGQGASGAIPSLADLEKLTNCQLNHLHSFLCARYVFVRMCCSIST